jgi:hypothetical protein
MLGVLTPEQADAKNRVEDYLKTSTAFKEHKIEAFVEPSELDFESLLRAFLDADRLKRAKGIKDDELKIEKETDKRVEAAIREYHIVIDFETRTILHDCADWSKMLPAKRFCKHIGKLLLSMDIEKATNVLRSITHKNKCGSSNNTHKEKSTVPLDVDFLNTFLCVKIWCIDTHFNIFLVI